MHRVAKKKKHSHRESEEKFAKAFRCSPQPFTLSTLKEDRYIEVNEAFELKTGYRREEVIARTVDELGIWVDYAERGKLVEKIVRGEPIRNVECRFRKKTGEVFIGLLSAELLELAGEMCVVANVIDITEWKYTEEKLREYERAVENAEEMIAVIDREYRYLIANRQFLKMRNMTREQVVGHFAHEVLKREVFEAEVKSKLDDCFRGNVIRYEMKYAYPELGERDVLVSYFPIEGVTGIDRVACILQDITDRKRATEALRASEELLKTFVKNVPAPVAMLDRDMHYLQVSDRWCSDYLAGREQILGRSHYELFQDMPERWKEVHRRSLAGETLRADEDRWEGQDGPHWARWEVRPWKTPEGTVGGILILAEDITGRKKMEQAVHEGEERLRLAAQAGKMFAYSWDAATDAITRSGESSEILGVTTDQAATGTAISEMVHPDDKERLKVALAKLTPQNSELDITYRMNRPDGSVLWLQRNSRAYFDAHARLVRIVGMIADVTERKRAEQSLAEMTRKLIEAQEQERSRIGRELHDDINQRLALLNVQLEQLQENPSDVGILAQELRKQATDISNDIQALSHDLHSSQLDYLGIVAGMKSWCKEFAERPKRTHRSSTSVVKGYCPMESRCHARAPPHH